MIRRESAVPEISTGGGCSSLKTAVLVVDLAEISGGQTVILLVIKQTFAVSDDVVLRIVTEKISAPAQDKFFCRHFQGSFEIFWRRSRGLRPRPRAPGAGIAPSIEKLGREAVLYKFWSSRGACPTDRLTRCSRKKKITKNHGMRLTFHGGLVAPILFGVLDGKFFNEEMPAALHTRGGGAHCDTEPR